MVWGCISYLGVGKLFLLMHAYRAKIYQFIIKNLEVFRQKNET